MDMRADLLTGFRRAKNPNDRNFWLFVKFRRLDISLQLRIKLGRCSLIMINAIKTYSKEVHGKVYGLGRRHPARIEIVSFHDVTFLVPCKGKNYSTVGIVC